MNQGLQLNKYKPRKTAFSCHWIKEEFWNKSYISGQVQTSFILKKKKLDFRFFLFLEKIHLLLLICLCLSLCSLYKAGSIKDRDCADLLSALISNPSHLRELDLNGNKLEESGLQELCKLIQNPLCKLEKLK